MDNTLRLRFDSADDTQPPTLHDHRSKVYPPRVAVDDDALASARGILVGVACALPFWVLIVMLAM